MSRSLLASLRSAAVHEAHALLLGTALAWMHVSHPVLAEGALGAFRYQREISVEKAGPQHLRVDLDLLSGASPGLGLADLRLFDAGGGEIPYLLVPPNPPRDVWRDGRHLVPIPSTRDQSGFEVDFGSTLTIDRLRIVGIPSPMMKRVSLEGAADHTHYNVLARDETVFDLPDQGLVRLEVDFVPGQYRYLRATWDDRATSLVPLPRSVSAHLSQPVPTQPPSIEPLTFERRLSKAGTSRFRIGLPAKALPIAAVRLEVAETELHRPASITEPRFSGRALEPVTLGRSVLKRQSHGDLSASELQIAIEHPTSAEIDLVVDDGDNPPLILKTVEAILAPQPFVYFEAKDTRSLEARFGNAKAHAPKYDLEVVRDALPSRAANARWAGQRRILANPEAASSTAPVSSVLLGGAPLDTTAFGYHRDLVPGPGGLVSVRLDAAVLAHSPGLADVRIGDVRNRQVPYLVEKEQEPLVLSVVLEGLVPSDRGSLPPRRSYHRIRLPYATLPDAHLELSTPVRVFTRSVSIWTEVRDRGRDGNGKRWNMVDERTFRHIDSATPTPPFQLPLPSSEDIVVGIDDGDNDALPITSASVVASSYRLRFFRESGAALRLFYGSPGMSAPQYDLALLQADLDGVTSVEAGMGPERANASPAQTTDRQSKWFWAVFGVAVVTLLGIIARLVRKAEAPQSP